jgi:hypothetical protein
MRKFITTITLVLLIYVVATQYLKNQPVAHVTSQESDKPKTTENKTSGSFVEKSLTNIIMNVIQTPNGREAIAKVLQPLNESGVNINQLNFKMNNSNIIDNILKIQTSGISSSRKAICGSIVDVEYQIKEFSNIESETKREIITLGSDSINIGLSTIIVGMSEGQKRTGVISDQLGNRNGNDTPKNIEVTLHKIVSNESINDSNVKIFDSILTSYVPCLCGEKFNINIKISRFDGTEIFNSKNDEYISYRIGDHGFPLIFAYGIFNKLRSGTRTIITQGKYFRDFGKNQFKLGKINDSEYYIMDITIPINYNLQ